MGSEPPKSEGSNELTDEAKGRILTSAAADIITWKEQIASINGKIRAKRKELKGDGFTRPEVDYAVYLTTNSPEAAQAMMALQMRIAEWMGRPLGFQPGLDLGGGDGAPLH